MKLDFRQARSAWLFIIHRLTPKEVCLFDLPNRTCYKSSTWHIYTYSLSVCFFLPRRAYLVQIRPSMTICYVFFLAHSHLKIIFCHFFLAQKNQEIKVKQSSHHHIGAKSFLKSYLNHLKPVLYCLVFSVSRLIFLQAAEFSGE